MFVVLELFFISVFVLGAIYFLYRLVKGSMDAKRKAEEKQKKEEENDELFAEFVHFDQAKAIIISHAEKLSQKEFISFDEAVAIVLSSEYLPGAGHLTIPDEQDIENLEQQPTAKRAEERQ